MENLKVVSQVISDIEKKNWEGVEKNLTDDFTFSGAVPQPIGKKEWVSVHRAIQTGIPDLKMNLQKPTEKGNKVTAKLKLTGTHTAEIPAPLPGMKSIPTTGRKVVLPEEDVEFTFQGDKISGLYVKPVPHGGVQGIIEQLK